MIESKYQHKYNYKILFNDGRVREVDGTLYRDSRGLFDIDLDDLIEDIKKDVGTTLNENSSVSSFELQLKFDQPKERSASR